jgi:hypothetical protein
MPHFLLCLFLYTNEQEIYDKQFGFQTEPKDRSIPGLAQRHEKHSQNKKK